MSADRFINAMKMHGQTQMAGMGQVVMALISSVNAAAGLVKALVQPENVQRSWMPLCSPWVGNGWGFYAPPLGNEQFVMLPQEGDGEHLIAAVPIWSKLMRPPPAKPGEMWMKHQAGSIVKMTNDGKVTFLDAAGTSLVLNNDGTAILTGILKVVGDIQASGNITDMNGAHGTMGALRTAYDAHGHGNVQNGIGTTATTDHPV